MLQPKKTKYRKQFKGRIHGLTKGGASLNFGSHGLKAVEPERVTARQIEAARRAITRQMKRQGRVWIRIFPDVPVSDKPAEVRMGKGKGAIEYWAARVAPGRIMFEIDGVADDVAREALRLGAAGFIPKSSSLDEIVEAVTCLIAGMSWAPDVEDAPEENNAAERLASLTAAQQRVLVGLQKGLLNKQIAYDSGISEATVKAHMTAIFRKLGVHSRTQAVLAAKRWLMPEGH